MARGRAAGTDVGWPGQRKLVRVRCYRTREVFCVDVTKSSDGGFWNDCPRVLALTCIHDIVPVIDGQNLLPIQPYLNQCLVLLRKPEPINFLVLPYEVSALDPERQFFRGMAFDPHHRIVVHINPEFPLKQIFVLPLGQDLGDNATIQTHLLFAQRV